MINTLTRRSASSYLFGLSPAHNTYKRLFCLYAYQTLSIYLLILPDMYGVYTRKNQFGFNLQHWFLFV